MIRSRNGHKSHYFFFDLLKEIKIALEYDDLTIDYRLGKTCVPHRTKLQTLDRGMPNVLQQ